MGASSQVYELPNSFVYNPELKTPTVLSWGDVQTYYKAFKLLHVGDYKGASTVVSHVDNPILLGYVQYHKYMSKAYRSSVTELKQWLVKYHDLPIAQDIYKLLIRKVGRNSKIKIPKPLVVGSIRPIYTRKAFIKEQAASSSLSTDIIGSANVVTIHPHKNHITRKLDTYLKRGETKLVKNTLLSVPVIKALDYKTYAYYAALLAKAYFYDGHTDYAIEWGEKALRHCSKYLADTNFIMGLAYWRKADYINARKYFEEALKYKDLCTPEAIAKLAYWSSRASFRLHDFIHYYRSLRVASDYMYEFYGILASEELGVSPQYNSHIINSDDVDLENLLQNPHGLRAMALLQFGLTNWAEQELILLAKYDLKRFAVETRTLLVRSMAYLAYKEPMPMLSLRLAGMQGMYYGFGYLEYPIFNVGKLENYTVDPLLLIAVMRRESSFNSDAISSAGAIGLMQLMPSTAKMLIQNADFITKFSKLTLSDYNLKRILRNPKYNFTLGQQYMQKLLNSRLTKHNLVYALASWNGGVLNLLKWRSDKYRMAQDRLFFIENIPFEESREFVKKVLTDYWVYQVTIGATPSVALNLIDNVDPTYVDPSVDYIRTLDSFNYDLTISNDPDKESEITSNSRSNDSSEEDDSYGVGRLSGVDKFVNSLTLQ